MEIASILWLVPILPALGALVNGLRAVATPLDRKNKIITNAIAVGSTALSALLATWVLLAYVRHGVETSLEVVYYEWIPSGWGHVAGDFIANFQVNLGFRVDTLSLTMMMVVTWVGFLIHVYATGYMAHEEGYTRFFTYLNLFMFMMLLLVMGNNYLVMFIGWEGVGLCSYLLIGFYYDKNFAADAGKKAFIVNRIGDFGFLLGIFLMFNYFGSVDFTKVFALAASDPAQFSPIATAICLLLFLGACGKSAQVPLYVWLPDAMAGPTPVSALIHAATMVTAGVYMVVRSNVLFRLSPTAMAVVAIVGAFTAIFAATIGIAQNDIKKVLAYSTVSQLGFMFVAAGVGAFTAAIFHLMTHAFFKACLFLGSGSVIHGCGGEQDMRKMGGLKKYMPSTRMTMLLATLAICGVPMFAGFFSKDEILANAFGYSPYIWVVGAIAATFTSFYMFRLYFMTFEGEYRGFDKVGIEESEPSHAKHDMIDSHTGLDDGDAHSAHGHGHHAHAPHESPLSMTGVLWVLGILSIIGGYVGWPVIWGGSAPTLFQKWLEPVLLPLGGKAFHFHEASHSTEWALVLISTLIAVSGPVIAWVMYGRDPQWSIPKSIAARFPVAYRIVANKYYVDEIYGATVIGGTVMLARAMAWFDTYVVDGLVNLTRHITVYLGGHGSNLFDKYIVDGAVNGIAYSAKESSGMLRRLQTGVVQYYALVMGGGIVLMAVVYLYLKP